MNALVTALENFVVIILQRTTASLLAPKITTKGKSSNNFKINIMAGLV